MKIHKLNLSNRLLLSLIPFSQLLILNTTGVAKLISLAFAIFASICFAVKNAKNILSFLFSAVFIESSLLLISLRPSEFKYASIASDVFHQNLLNSVPILCIFCVLFFYIFMSIIPNHYIFPRSDSRSIIGLPTLSIISYIVLILYSFFTVFDLFRFGILNSLFKANPLIDYLPLFYILASQSRYRLLFFRSFTALLLVILFLSGLRTHFVMVVVFLIATINSSKLKKIIPFLICLLPFVYAIFTAIMHLRFQGTLDLTFLSTRSFLQSLLPSLRFSTLANILFSHNQIIYCFGELVQPTKTSYYILDPIFSVIIPKLPFANPGLYSQDYCVLYGGALLIHFLRLSSMKYYHYH